MRNQNYGVGMFNKQKFGNQNRVKLGFIKFCWFILVENIHTKHCYTKNILELVWAMIIQRFHFDSAWHYSYAFRGHINWDCHWHSSCLGCNISILHSNGITKEIWIWTWGSSRTSGVWGSQCEAWEDQCRRAYVKILWNLGVPKRVSGKTLGLPGSPRHLWWQWPCSIAPYFSSGLKPIEMFSHDVTAWSQFQQMTVLMLNAIGHYF